LLNRDKERDSQVLSGCNVDLNKRIIVFTTDNISISETEQMLNGVINAVLKIEDIRLVIKVHPREELAIYQAVAEKYHNSRIIVVKDVDLYALISNSLPLLWKQ
jgi:hypothetical protein